MSPLVIGVCAPTVQANWEHWRDKAAALVPADIVFAIQQLKGIVAMFPVDSTVKADLGRVVSLLDGLVIVSFGHDDAVHLAFSGSLVGEADSQGVPVVILVVSADAAALGIPGYVATLEPLFAEIR
jgi:hypothetical protein